MDIQKEEKFEALPEIEMMLRENPDIKFENGGYVCHGLNQLTALAVCYVAGAWMAWKEAKAQAVPEVLKKFCNEHKDPAWRGRLTEYDKGYSDCCIAVLEMIEAALEPAND